MNKKLIFSLILVSILVLGTIGFLLVQAKIIATNAEAVIFLHQVTKQVQFISQESFHTQLELWEYINDPNQERLDAFNQHNQELSKKIETLTLLNNNQSSLYQGGKKDLETLTNNFQEIELSWSLLLKRADEYIYAIQDAQVHNISSLQSPKVVTTLVALRQQTSDSEKKFDDLQINETIETFVQNQSIFTDHITAQLQQSNVVLNIGLLILASLYLILLTLIAVWLGSMMTTFKSFYHEKKVNQKA